MKIFRNRTVVGVLCILLALLICFGVTPLFSRSASEKTEIVRVTADIKEGDEITAEMVQTVEVGAYNLPSGIMTDKDDVIGKYATADLKMGDYILDSKLSYEPAAENAYLYSLDGNKQAISVTIKSFATGLSGKLESGDIVSVLVADYKGMGETVIPPELQYVEVISVTASSGYDANTGEAVEDEKELPSTVTLLVTTEQAKVLAGLEQESELHLALVYRGAPENADEFIAAQDARRTMRPMSSAVCCRTPARCWTTPVPSSPPVWPKTSVFRSLRPPCWTRTQVLRPPSESSIPRI